jgi:hypothetical protein
MNPQTGTNYYMLLLKKRQAKSLTKYFALTDSRPYVTKSRMNLLHRLQVNGILLAQFISELDIFNYMLLNLSCLDDAFDSPLQMLEFQQNNTGMALTMEAIFSHRELLKLKTSAPHYLNELLISVDDCEMDQDSTDVVKEELSEAFNFLIEIIRLIPFRSITLAIVSSPKEVTFPRYLPADKSFGRKGDNINDGFFEE